MRWACSLDLRPSGLATFQEIIDSGRVSSDDAWFFCCLINVIASDEVVLRRLMNMNMMGMSGDVMGMS